MPPGLPLQSGTSGPKSCFWFVTGWVGAEHQFETINGQFAPGRSPRTGISQQQRLVIFHADRRPIQTLGLGNAMERHRKPRDINSLVRLNE
ncbi:MAG: hypothetical protein QOI22_2123 [Verrucomicrobiota bacterium]|jgi:hypothetical protein